jgi:hypothetical protein
VNLDLIKLELDATTLRPQDASEEARLAAEQDATLASWLKQRTLFDEQMAAAFAVPAMPAGLRDLILSKAQQPKRRSVRWLLPSLASVAAALALGWSLCWPGNAEMPAWQADAIASVAKLQYGMSRLDQRAPTLDAVKQMLAAKGAPLPAGTLPGTFSALPTYGCKRIQVGNRPASIICFKMPSGHEAHLVVMDTADLESKAAHFSSSKNWNMATWSEGKQTFMLATTSDAAELKKLLGLS